MLLQSAQVIFVSLFNNGAFAWSKIKWVNGAVGFMKPNKCYGLFVCYREKESRQEPKLQSLRLSYPFTSQRLKWKFTPFLNHALQSFKCDPHIFFLFQETGWLDRRQICCEDSPTNLELCTWICFSVSPFLSYETINDHPQENFYLKVS